MTAITVAKKSTDRQDGTILSFKQGAEKIPEGALVMVNAAGYAVNATDTAGGVVVGIADETVDNSAGSVGDKSIKVRRSGVFNFVFGGTATIADVNTLVYVVDNQTVDLVGVTTNDVLVGRIVEFVTATKVRVDIRDRA
jgi:hypothetical protein